MSEIDYTGQEGAQALDAFGEYTLDAPGLHGTSRELDVVESATRSDGGLVEPKLIAALESQMQIRKMFELNVSDELVPRLSEGDRDPSQPVTRDNEQAMKLKVPSYDGHGHVVMYTDESGITRWYFPEEHRVGRSDLRSSGTVTFHLPLLNAPPPPENQRLDPDNRVRGGIAKLFRRTVRVLTWATEEVLGDLAYKVAQKVEDQYRPYELRVIDPGKYDANNIGRILKRGDSWDFMDGKRTLLLIHGTFSRAESSFTGWNEDKKQPLDDLAKRYGGRILAFNHPTNYENPYQNAQWFLKQIPKNINLEFDMITHSRGGLVGRVLSERRIPDAANVLPRIKIHNAVFVAAPNQGTLLAEAENGIRMIDRYTSMLTNMPDNIYTIGLEVILMAVKLIYNGALHGLPGLKIMTPKDNMLGELNRPISANLGHEMRYYALTSDYTPALDHPLATFFAKVGDKLVDGVFQNTPNDLVVPTLGSYTAENNTDNFPIMQREVLYNVHHLEYFENSVANQTILKWLGKL